jgi:two-component system chemotaxis response regulator CheB
MDNSRTLIVGIGGSGAEGLADLMQLLALMPGKLNASLLVVLHRPSDSVSYLREVLQMSSTLPIEVAKQGAQPASGICYVGTSDRILTVREHGLFHLLDGTNNRFRNQTVDVLLHSLALLKSSAMGVILSGSLADGSRGLAAIHAAGGLTAVLDPKGKARGMQENAITYDGKIDKIGSHTEIASLIQAVSAPMPRQRDARPAK